MTLTYKTIDMKIFLLTLYFIRLTLLIQAQYITPDNGSGNPNRFNGNATGWNVLLPAEFNTPVSKPMSMRQRLIGVTYNYYTDYKTITVNTKATYSNNRGSQFDPHLLVFSFRSSLQPVICKGFEIYPGLKEGVLADSITATPLNESGTINSMVFNERNLMIASTIQYPNAESGISTYQYDRSDRLIGGHYIVRADTVLLRKLRYNPDSTLILADNTFRYKSYGDPAMTSDYSGWKFVYDDQNKLLSAVQSENIHGSYQPVWRYTYTYTNDQKLNTVKSESWLMDHRINFLDSFIYQQGSPAFSEIYSFRYDINPPKVELVTRNVFCYNTDALVDTIYTYTTGGLAGTTSLSSFLVYEYNSFQNPAYIKRYQPFRGQPKLLETFTYDYSTYEDSIEIKDVPSPEIFMFPNPFQQRLSISWQGTTSNHFTLRFLKISGEEVIRKTIILQSGYNIVLLPDLPTGNYIVQLKDNTQGKSWSQRLLKI